MFAGRVTELTNSFQGAVQGLLGRHTQVKSNETETHTAGASDLNKDTLRAVADQYKSHDEDSPSSKRLCLSRPHVGLEIQNTLQQLIAKLSTLLHCGPCESLQDLRQAIS